MSYAVIDLITTTFYNVFGSGYIMALVLVGVLLMIMLALRANLTVILIVLIPLVVGLVLNTAGSNFIDFAPWILLVLFMLAGFLFYTVFLIFK